MEKFSVLISVYAKEQADYLSAALRSIFDQSAPPTEVVLVKDGPLTDTLDAVAAEFMARYDTLKIVALPHNVGLGEALNQGLKHCSYELVARMDSDDICKSDRFAKQLAVFDHYPEVSLVGSWIDEFVENPNIVESTRQVPEFHNEILQFAKAKNPTNHMGVMFAKSAVEKAGGYQTFYLLEDYWLWFRMLQQGAKFYNIQQSLVLVRGGSAMAARRGGWKYAKSEIRLQSKMLRGGFIGLLAFLKNVAIRFTVRMIPNKMRTFVYRKLLR